MSALVLQWSKRCLKLLCLCFCLPNFAGEIKIVKHMSFCLSVDGCWLAREHVCGVTTMSDNRLQCRWCRWAFAWKKWKWISENNFALEARGITNDDHSFSNALNVVSRTIRSARKLYNSIWKQTTTGTFLIIIIININPLTARVVGAPQMILQPVFSIFPCSPLPFGTCQIPGLSIPRCCLPTSSFVRLVFFPLSLCLARWFWPDLMNGKLDHTTAVCVSLRSPGGLRVAQLPAGSWHWLPGW